MKKQIWIICNEQEQQELINKLFGYKIDINCSKLEFPIVIDTETKTAFRCESVSCCAAYTIKYGKIKKYSEIKSKLNTIS